ncbi:acyltransferase family protein [Pseudomonas putida]|uniref:acyltransferase family protein n=1 Tax=Pseudomonas putida TaxID=303 RepID=UPI0020C26539|nr:acyltransferase family protein [Pseudomonas putida]UTL79543.1 acyltransferase [Pseudomonas putida]
MWVSAALRSASGYKPFIDGLRALSILAVVAYHAGVSWVSGGFVGVDVFFVISGFLIVTHILSSLDAKTFSFGEFWARRALRILPPYLLVILACSIAAPFVLVLPKELTDFGNQVAYSAAMLANHYFLSQQGYFDGLADTKPLLHLWSLAVEEQFYLVAPVVIFSLYSISRKLTDSVAAFACFIVIFVIAAFSLFGSITLSGGGAGKNYAFFLMPLRAWEFIAGGVIAFMIPLMQRMPRLIVEVAACLGLWMIGFSIFTYSGASPYPSWKAIYPVAGAALIILCGVSNPRIMIARALAIKPFVAIGLVSYAWYLWHWPLLTFGRMYNFGERILPFDLAMVAVSLLLAWATYVLVDKKILAWRKRLPRGAGWAQTAMAVSLCIPLGISGWYMANGYAASVSKGFTEAQTPKPATRAGICDLHFIADPAACVKSAQTKTMGLLIGDSHADAAYRGLSKHANENESVLATMSSGGCAAMLDVHVNNPDLAMQGRCENGRDNALKMVGVSIKPKYAILFSSWTIYAGRGRYSLSEPGSTEPFPDTQAGFVGKLKDTYDYLKSKGVERILVIAPVPIFKSLAPTCVMRSDRYRLDRDKHCSIPRLSAEKERSDVVKWLNESIIGEQNVRLIDPIENFCDAMVCRSYGEEGVLYVDTNHIGDSGLERIYKAETPSFKWVFGESM